MTASTPSSHDRIDRERRALRVSSYGALALAVLGIGFAVFSGSEAILLDVEWSATWESIDPAPTQAQPDDFDWTAEIVVLVPARYVIDVPSF